MITETEVRHSGQIIVFFALILTILVSIAGVAVDLAHVRSVAEDAQRAADAGALAGVVYLPSNPTLAETQAGAVSTQNGYTATNASPCPSTANAVCIDYTPNALQRTLRENITVEVPTFFLRVIGIDTIAVQRAATATYDDPIPLGAPDHMLGFAPYPTHAISSTVPFGQGFYLELRGPFSGLEHGDAYSPYFETRNGDKLLVNSSSDASGTFSAENNVVDEATCATYNPYNAIVNPTGSKTTRCKDSSGNWVNLVNNQYYNAQNTDNPTGSTGYNFEFSLPPDMSHPVLIKVLNPYDECSSVSVQNYYNSLTVYGPSGLGGGGASSIAPVSTEKIDQCDAPYFGYNSYTRSFFPTSLQFTLYTPSTREADTTAALSPNASTGVATDPLGNWTVEFGTHAGSSNPNPQTFGADPNTKVTTVSGVTTTNAHGFQWFSLAKVQNTSSQTLYIRMSIAAVQNQGGSYDGTFGQGGHNFSLAVCKVDGTAGAVGDPTNSGAWAAANAAGDPGNASPDGQALYYDTGCADPNIQYNSDGYGCPDYSSNGDITCYTISARQAFCLETLQPQPGPAFIPIAAIDSSYAGASLTLELFDAGDIGGGGTNTINILSPNDDPASYVYSCGGNVCGTNHSEPINLDIAAPTGSNYGAIGAGRTPGSGNMAWWGNSGSPYFCAADYNAFDHPNSDGAICPPLAQPGVTTGVYPADATYSPNNAFGNDVWLNMHITLPASYSPPETNQWWKVYYNLSNTGANDTTTWAVNSGSSPVHLIGEY